MLSSFVTVDQSLRFSTYMHARSEICTAQYLNHFLIHVYISSRILLLYHARFWFPNALNKHVKAYFDKKNVSHAYAMPETKIFSIGYN